MALELEGIKLRTNKGTALTYDEMDRNLSQYFFSSSLHGSGAELRLHYTGSNNLDTPNESFAAGRYQSIAVGSGDGGTQVTIGQSAGTVLQASAQSVILANTPVDGNVDRLLFFDGSSKRLEHLELGTGLSISGTVLNATGGSSGGTMSSWTYSADDGQIGVINDGDLFKVLGGVGITVDGDPTTGSVTIDYVGGGGETSPAGTIHGAIQYRDDTGNLFQANSSMFVFDPAEKRLGIGTASPVQQLHLKGDRNQKAVIRMVSDPGIGDNDTWVEMFDGTAEVGKLGKVHSFGQIGNDICIYASDTRNNNKVHLLTGPSNANDAPSGAYARLTAADNGIGIGTILPNKKLTIIQTDSSGIGIGNNTGDDQSEIRRIDSVLGSNFLNNISGNKTTQGLFIHPSLTEAEGGHLVLAVTDSNDGITSKDTPNRVSIVAIDNEGPLGDFEGPSITSFLSNGTVGIGTEEPDTQIKLTIEGNYRGAYKLRSTLDATLLDFRNYRTYKIIASNNGSGTYAMSATGVPPAGVRGTVIFENMSAFTKTISTTNSSVEFNSTIILPKNNYAVLEMVSDGTRMIEVSVNQ